MLFHSFDARGHKVPGILAMRVYYRGDSESLQVLRKFPSKSIVIVPHVTISMDLTNQVAARVAIVYPLEQVTTEVILTASQLEWIREIYHNPSTEWESKRWGNMVYITRIGRIVHVKDAPSPIVPLVGEGY